MYIRGQKAKIYGLFISKHTNANDVKIRRVEVFYDYTKPKDAEFAQQLSDSVSSEMGNNNRKAKTRVYTKAG